MSLKSKGDIEKRLGRVRETKECQAQLVLKPLPRGATEQRIREVAFKGFNIQRVDFTRDALDNRCAIITFGSAEEAIAAHSGREYVQFGNKRGPRWTRVLYAYAFIRHWGEERSLDQLMTRAEWRVFREQERARTIAAQEAKMAKRIAKEEKEAMEAMKAAKAVDIADAEEEIMPSEKTSHKRLTPPVSEDEPAVKKFRVRSQSGGGGGHFRDTSAAARDEAPFRGRFNARGGRGGRGTFPVRSSRGTAPFRGSFSPRRNFSRGFRGNFSNSHDRRSDFDSRSSFRFQQNSYGSGHDNAGHRRGYRGKSSDDYVPRRAMRNSSTYDSYRVNSYSQQQSQSRLDSDALMEEKIREQRRQLELQEQLLRQQHIIDDLSGQLRTRASASTSANYASGTTFSDSPIIGGSRSPAYGQSSNAARDSWAASYSSEFNSGHDQSSSSYDSAWR